MSGIYNETAKASFDNAVAIYNEACLLLEQKQSPRSYALAVISMEELSKSLTCKGIWAGLADSSDLIVRTEGGRKRNALKDHVFKQLTFGMFPALRQAFYDNGEQLLSPGKVEPESLDLKKAREIMEIFKGMEEDRLNALHVGMEEDKVVSPKESISTQQCETLLSMIAEILPYYQSLLTMNVDEYRAYCAQFADFIPSTKDIQGENQP